MNPYLATILVALPSAALTGWVLPFLLDRRKERRESRAGSRRESDQNLQTLSNRMAGERDRAEELARQAVANTERALARQAEVHTAEIAKMQAAHSAEIAQMRAAHLRESKSANDRITSLSQQLAECREQVSSLVGDILELRSKIPPDTRPTAG